MGGGRSAGGAVAAGEGERSEAHGVPAHPSTHGAGVWHPHTQGVLSPQSDTHMLGGAGDSPTSHSAPTSPRIWPPGVCGPLILLWHPHTQGLGSCPPPSSGTQILRGLRSCSPLIWHPWIWGPSHPHPAIQSPVHSCLALTSLGVLLPPSGTQRGLWGTPHPSALAHLG